jgi:integrase
MSMVVVRADAPQIQSTLATQAVSTVTNTGGVTVVTAQATTATAGTMKSINDSLAGKGLDSPEKALEKFAIRRVTTKTKNRSAAEQILARYEAEVARIKSGVVTREELTKTQTPRITLGEALERFRIKMVASGCTPKTISTNLQQVMSMLHACNVDSIAKIRREAVERWIADEIQKKVYTPKTINHYLTSVRSFVQYLTDVEILPSNPLKPIKKLNPEIGQRKKRRAMTAEEVERFMKAVTRKSRTKKQSEERSLVYRLLLGTGLRSTELSLLTPSQIDFERNRLTIEAAKTKNKKADVLPIRPDLVQSVKEWVEAAEKIMVASAQDRYTADSWGFAPNTAQGTNRPATAAHEANTADKT